jgi:hypothetical protein
MKLNKAAWPTGHPPSVVVTPLDQNRFSARLMYVSSFDSVGVRAVHARPTNPSLQTRCSVLKQLGVEGTVQLHGPHDSFGLMFEQSPIGSRETEIDEELTLIAR